MKRNRLFVLALLPVAVFLWFVGWSLYWIGKKREREGAEK